MTTLSDENCGCALFCGECLGFTALVGSSVAYFLFAILGLVKEYDDAKECNFGLWVYVLVQLFLSVCRKNEKKVVERKNCGDLVCSFLVNTGFGVWGFIEITNSTNCMDHSSYLFVIGYIMMLVNLVVVVIFVLITIFGFSFSYYKKNLKKNVQYEVHNSQDVGDLSVAELNKRWEEAKKLENEMVVFSLKDFNKMEDEV